MSSRPRPTRCAKARLAKLGIPVKFEADYEPGRRLYFHDHDDHEVELVEY